MGRKVDDGKEADEIKKNLTAAFGDKIENLTVTFDDGTVTLRGTADSVATREKAVLIAGNIKNVEKVDDQLGVKVQVVEKAPVFYTIEKGDSLSKIAKAKYGDAMKWKALFEANEEVIENPDLIYPGQRIRIPELA
jgi:nucleoid-associated protein YgaU